MSRGLLVDGARAENGEEHLLSDTQLDPQSSERTSTSELMWWKKTTMFEDKRRSRTLASGRLLFLAKAAIITPATSN